MDSEVMTFTEKFSPPSVAINSVYWCGGKTFGPMVIEFKGPGRKKWKYDVLYAVFKEFGNSSSAEGYYAQHIKGTWGVPVDHVKLQKLDLKEPGAVSADFEIVYLDPNGQEIFFPVKARDETDALQKAANVLAGFVGLNFRISRVTHYFG